MDELKYFKEKTGWKVVDRDGNSASGLTKGMARSAYFLRYKLEDPSQKNYVDMKRYTK